MPKRSGQREGRQECRPSACFRRAGGRAVSDYHINIFYSDEDGGYIADIPDLAACSAFGKTPHDALRQVEIAKKAWIAAAKSSGKRLPKPRYRPAIYHVTS